MKNRKQRFWFVLIGLLVVFAAISIQQLERADANERTESTGPATSRQSNLRRNTSADIVSTSLLRTDHVRLEGTVWSEKDPGISSANVCASCSDCDLGLLGESPTCVLTDENGFFRLELRPGTYRISCLAQGYLPSFANRGQVVRVVDEPLSKLDIQLEPGGAEVSGIVKDATGGIVQGALVRANFSHDSLPKLRFVAQKTTTNEEGMFRLWVKPGGVRLIASAEGYAPADIFRVAPTKNVELIVSPESSISGIVVTARQNKPVPNIRVYASGQNVRQEFGLTDDSGMFRIDSLRPGIYQVKASGTGWLGVYPQPVSLDMADVVDNLQLEVYRTGSIYGKLVTDSDETPCESGIVTLIPVVEDGTLPSLVKRTDSQGKVSFEAVPPGTYSSFVECEGYGEQAAQTISMGDRVVSGVIWKASRLISIVGKARGPDEQPVAGLQIELSRNGPSLSEGYASNLFPQLKETDETGNVVFSGLVEGSYSIRSRYLNAPLSLELSEEEPTVHVDLKIDPTGYIKVYVHDPEGTPLDGLTVSAISGEKMMPSGFGKNQGAGYYLIGPVAVGDHWIEVRDGFNPRFQGKGKSQTVEVFPHETATADVEYGGYQGRITGRVIFSQTEEPAANIWVQAVPEEHQDDFFRFVAQLTVEVEGKRSLSEPDGHFELNGLSKTATFTVVAKRPLGGDTKVKGIKAGQDIEIVL